MRRFRLAPDSVLLRRVRDLVSCRLRLASSERRRWFERILLVLAASVVIPVAGATGYAGHHPRAALRTNPPLAHTGGFGEPTCRKCHVEYDLNDTAGAVLIEGLPARWSADERYPVTITVLHPALVVGGFQASIRFEDGERAGKQAGRLMPVDSLVTTALDTLSNVQFVFHSPAGVTLGSQKGRAVWTFDWIAPPEDGSAVVVHVAANASNDDFSDLGDYVFARSVRIPGKSEW